MRNGLVVVALAACSSPAQQPPPPPQIKAVPAFVAPAPALAATPIVQPPERDPVAAWSLTASDGSGLRLVSVEAKAVIEGPLAFTELHLRFENPENRVREGTFAITLPQHAAVSRFAMEDNGKLTEAEVVPKALARRAYDDALHRGIDPAILEKAAGNEFTARVFPIPAHGIKHIVVSYSHELAGEGYLLPLRGLPKIDHVSVTLDAVRPDRTHQTQTLAETGWQPDRDFVANVVSPSAVATGALVAGAFQVSPTASARADRPTAITLLVDTSGSRAAGFTRYLAKVQALVRAIAIRYDQVQLDVRAFDQETRVIYTGPAKDFGDREIARLVERGAAGASDLAQAVASLGTAQRIVIVGDGVVTAGQEGAELAAAFGKLHVERVDVALAGGIRDDKVAAAVTRTGARPGDVFDLDRAIEPIARGLGEAVQVDVPIEVAGATWSYPRTLASLRAGTQVMVFARLAAPARSFAVTIGGSTETVDVVEATPALLERAAARATIDELEAKLAATPAAETATAAKLREQIETRSVAARVVSSQTTMLVLETDADYARYGIDRRSLADVLVIGPHGLEQSHRTFVAKAPRKAPPEPAPDDVALALDEGTMGKREGDGADGQYKLGHRDADPQLARQQAIEQARTAGILGSTDISSGFDSSNAFGSLTGTGRYGTIGHGSGTGNGYGAGAGGGASGGYGRMRSRVAAAPTIRLAQPSVVSGSLDRAIIRRYIKRNITKITYCYERQLLGHPALHGTITTQFIVGRDGKVTTATASGFDATVATCIADVIKTIEFPAVGDSIVQVNYPFTFRRAGTDDGASADEPAVTQTPEPPASAPDPAPHVEATPPPPPQTAPLPEPETAQTASPGDGFTFGPPIDALSGKLAKITRAIAHKHPDEALAIARAWNAEAPTDILAWVGLGQAFEASGNPVEAARAYGSIIDLYASHADFRRFAGERLEHAGEVGRALAVDTYRRAVADRPDQITGHRLLAYALLRRADYAGAWKAILAGADQEARADSYAGAPRVFAKDVSMIASAYAAHGGSRAAIAKELAKRSLDFTTTPSTRFILYWETDANDVDLHVRDAQGNHAYFSHKQLESGGELYADITTGFGPECFEIEGKPSAGPYELAVHYYAQGPMGYGMGLLQIERFEGKSFTFDDRPYVIMKNQAYVALGRTR